MTEYSYWKYIILTLLLGLTVSACSSLPLPDQAIQPTALVSEDSSTLNQSATSSKPTASDSAPESDQNQKANADVVFVEAEFDGESWTFRVTVSHPDTGWEDYADGWDVVLPDGSVLKTDPEDPYTRPLLHPHENEQPFTRSQSGLIIPDGIDQVTVKAHDLVDGFGGQEITLDLTASSGEKFQIIHPGN